MEYRLPGVPPINPKPYAFSSDDEFADGQIDHLIDLFEDLNTDPPHPHHKVSVLLALPGMFLT
jgi:hypothetical protein